LSTAIPAKRRYPETIPKFHSGGGASDLVGWVFVEGGEDGCGEASACRVG
jgi:hypothetical protein